MANSLTARDILTMTSDNLRKYVSDFNQDPKNMTKTDMQIWLLERAPPSEPASPVEIPGIPSFVSKLSPEMLLPYYLKKRGTRKRPQVRQVETKRRIRTH